MSSDELSALLRDPKPQTSASILSSKHYHLLGHDLRSLSTMPHLPSPTQSLFELGIDTSLPTLLISECVLTYLPPRESDPIISWAALTFTNSAFCIYEQVLPCHVNGSPGAFATQMISHFNAISSPLLSVSKYPSLESQVGRFKTRGYSNVEAISLNTYYAHQVALPEKTRLNNLEMHDEWEEWHNYLGHYFVLVGTTGELTKRVWFDACQSRAPLDGYIFDNKVPPTHQSIEQTALNLIPLRPITALIPPIKFHSSVTLNNSHLVIFGGTSGSRSCKTHIWDLNDTASRSPTTVSHGPDARENHTAHPVSSTLMIMYGGRSHPKRVFGDVQEFNIETREWTNLHDSTGPQRHRHASVFLNARLVVFGGIDQMGHVSGETWVFDYACKSWSLVYTRGTSPSPRHSSSLLCVNSRIYLYGGLSDTEHVLGDVWEFDLTNLVWIRIHDANLPPRYGHKCVATPTGFVVVGGITNPCGPPSTHQIFRVSLSWAVEFKAIEDVKLWCGHTLELIESELYVLGGGGVCFSMGAWFDSSSKLSLPELWLQPLGEDIPRIPLDKVDDVRVYREPVVITGLKLPSWDYTTFKNLPPFKKISVHTSSNPEFNFVKKNFTYKFMDWSDFIESVYNGTESEYTYLRSLSQKPTKNPADFFRDFPGLASTIKLPKVLQDLTSPEVYHSSVLRIGSKGMILWTHYDVMANVLVNVDGVKKVKLWHPSSYRSHYISGSSSPILPSTPIEILRGSYPRYLESFSSPTFETTLHPGQALVIPAFWFHQVSSLTIATSINIFYRHLSNEFYSDNGKDLYGNKDLRAYERCMVLVSQHQADLKSLYLELLHMCSNGDPVSTKGTAVRILRELNVLPEVERAFYLRKLVDEVEKMMINWLAFCQFSSDVPSAPRSCLGHLSFERATEPFESSTDLSAHFATAIRETLKYSFRPVLCIYFSARFRPQINFSSRKFWHILHTFKNADRLWKLWLFRVRHH